MNEREAIDFLIKQWNGAWPVNDPPMLKGEPAGVLIAPDGWKWVRIKGDWILQGREFLSTRMVYRGMYLRQWMNRDLLTYDQALEFLRENVTSWPRNPKDARPICTGWWWVRVDGVLIFISGQGYAPISEQEWKK